MLNKEYDFFKKNIKDFIENHLNEFVVIKNEKVIGFFNTEAEALLHMKNDEFGTFLVQQCSKNSLEPQEYHSRVAFV